MLEAETRMHPEYSIGAFWDEALVAQYEGTETVGRVAVRSLAG